MKRAEVLFNVFVHYLSMLSPRSKRIYVFGAWRGQKFSDNPKYLYLQACNDKNFTAVWITRNKTIASALKARGYKAYLHNSLPGLYYQLRASVYFTCMSKQDVFSNILGNATRINLWHGVGLKKILNDDKITKRKHANTSPSLRTRLWKKIERFPRRKEYIVSTSDTMTAIFANAFGKKKEALLQLGQPRNDVFFDDALEFEPFPFKDEFERIILYMPTHRKEGKEKMCMAEILDLDALNRFCAENNALFLIKKHYYHHNEVENFERYPNIKDITRNDWDAQQLLKHADVLITDYSSCFVDFLLLDRPVIFYNYDYDEYVMNDRDLYFDYNTTTPGAKVKNFNELYAALKRVTTTGDDAFGESRERVKNIFYSPDNQKAVGRKILDFVRNNV